MIKVNFSEPTTNAWKDWRKKAEVETKLVKQKATKKQPLTFKDALYKEMRKEIFEAYFNKCAYCEAYFVLDQTGDVEHYRPKGKITDENDKVVSENGYYWLAYDHNNLLPSCSKCNRPTKNINGKLVGKGTRFPVIGTFRATTHRKKLSKEKAVFLHPVFDEPTEHILFDEQTGMLIGKTDRGKMCIDLLDLNREGLPEHRRQIVTEVEARLFAAEGFLGANQGDKVKDQLQVLLGYRDGRLAYALPAITLLSSPTLSARLNSLLGQI